MLENHTDQPIVSLTFHEVLINTKRPFHAPKPSSAGAILTEKATSGKLHEAYPHGFGAYTASGGLPRSPEKTENSALLSTINMRAHNIPFGCPRESDTLGETTCRMIDMSRSGPLPAFFQVAGNCRILEGSVVGSVNETKRWFAIETASGRENPGLRIFAT
jgi:hypothetical protein